METNFFSQLEQLQTGAGWNIVIAQNAAGLVTVSVLMNAKHVTDNAKRFIPPMSLTGTAAELDTVFFKEISEPVKRTAALFTNMNQYLKEVEKAEAEAAAAAAEAETSSQQAQQQAQQHSDEKLNQTFQAEPSREDNNDSLMQPSVSGHELENLEGWGDEDGDEEFEDGQPGIEEFDDDDEHGNTDSMLVEDGGTANIFEGGGGGGGVDGGDATTTLQNEWGDGGELHFNPRESMSRD